jgi:hypothetical protein
MRLVRTDATVCAVGCLIGIVLIGRVPVLLYRRCPLNTSVAVLAVIVLGLGGVAASAQGRGKPSIAELVLSPKPLGHGHVEIQRRATATPHHLIVLDAELPRLI